MADRNTRRLGCGCLPVILVFLLGAVAAVVLGDAEGSELIGGLAVVLFGGFVAMILLALFTRRRRQEESERVVTGEPARPVPSVTRRDTGSGSSRRSDREVRSGARDLTTEPESEEAQTLKRRLREAVADLADNVEGMPSAGDVVKRGKTSEEMIAEAKRRITERARDLEN
ncbi:MAG TPA: hypothetical protein VHL52_03365 [Acidimicrobiia bacterium]|nr:hypothetical protein [Acidimicrobiia bacterium]